MDDPFVQQALIAFRDSATLILSAFVGAVLLVIMIALIDGVRSKIRERRQPEWNGLIMAVGNKYEGETRHETALRYILEAEQGSSEASDARADDE